MQLSNFKVKDLVSVLLQLDQESTIIVSSDAEGNSYSSGIELSGSDRESFVENCADLFAGPVPEFESAIIIYPF